MRKYTLKQIRDLPCMKMEEEVTVQVGVVTETFTGTGEADRNHLRHQLLEELKGEGK